MVISMIGAILYSYFEIKIKQKEALKNTENNENSKLLENYPNFNIEEEEEEAKEKENV